MSASLIDNEETTIRRRGTIGNNRILTQDKFDLLLDWLDSDRERAGIIYGEIQQQMIALLIWRGCTEPERLADRAMDIVADKISRGEVEKSDKRGQRSYCKRVAVHLHQDTRRRVYTEVPLPDAIAAEDFSITNDETEQMSECLDKCLAELTPNNRDLVLQYHQEEKQEKIDLRKSLAQKFGLTAVALRVRIHRIIEFLEHCAVTCYEKPDETD